MRKLFYLIGTIIIAALVIVACQKQADQIGQEDASLKGSNGCTKIQSGELEDSQGNPIETGFDEWGYNYQAQIFNGLYCKYDRNDSDCEGDGTDDILIMKWNDAWLSNTDCDGDGLLDRHFGYDSYIGSGAWLTNHQQGTYLDVDGNECHWNYFVKIVAVPADAYPDGGYWYNSDGTEIGPSIWGQFAIIQEVLNDPCAGINGLQYNSPDHAGLGGW